MNNRIDLVKNILKNLSLLKYLTDEQRTALFDKYYDMEDRLLIKWNAYYQSLVDNKNKKIQSHE